MNSQTFHGRGLVWAAGIVSMMALLIGAWAWVGRNVPTAAAGLQYPSLSYAPFGADQSPSDLPRTAQIEHDIALLSSVTRSIRIYSACDFGAPVLRAAERQRMAVWLGIWVSRDPVATRRELECGIQLARQFPTTVRRVIVGNEAVTRQDISISNLLKLIDEAKARIAQPVAYADVPFVWETDRQMGHHAEEVIVHLLPYWDSRFETGTAKRTARGVATYLNQIQELYPERRVIVGEVGWPTFGTSKFQSVPGRAFQTDFLTEFARLARERHIIFNVVEAFDQPWKARDEGVAGSTWGIFDVHRQLKVGLDGQVREDPLWRTHAWASLGIMVAGIGTAFLVARRYGIQLVSLRPNAIVMLCVLIAMASMASVLLWRQIYDLTGAFVTGLAAVFQVVIASIFSLGLATARNKGRLTRDAQACMKVALFSMFVENLRLACDPICHDVAIWAFVVPIALSPLAISRDQFRTVGQNFGSWIIALLNVLAATKTAMIHGYGNVQINMWFAGVILIALPYLAYSFLSRRQAEYWRMLGILASFAVLICAVGFWDMEQRQVDLICQMNPESLICWRSALSRYQVLGWLSLLLASWGLWRRSVLIAVGSIHLGILAVANWNLTLGSFAIAIAAIALDAPAAGREPIAILKQIRRVARFGAGGIWRHLNLWRPHLGRGSHQEGQ
ncbi:glycoside hydrolase family 17 protein [Rhizorhabdus argentea]|uniref:hypothetical protein n=1 Tax=Rhizorhabdus argentea TaxID=1387174 RepID=UPI0030EEC7F1